MNITIADLVPLTILAIVAEALTERVKDLMKEPTPRKMQWLSLGIGLALAFLLNVSLFEGVTGREYYVGVFLAGIFCGRGSNYLHDLLGRISASWQEA